MASPSGTPGSRRDPDEIQPGECHNCGYSAEVCECESPDFEPPADPVVSPAAVTFAPRLIRVACSQFAACQWHGKRLVSKLGVQPDPCPKCGNSVVA